MTEFSSKLPVIVQTEQRGPSMMMLVSMLVLTVIVNLAVTLFFLDRYDLLGDREIVSVNAADTLMAFVASQDPTISSEELEARVKQLNSNIDAMIQGFATERGVIVVNSAAVLAGARDATGDLLAHLEIAK